MEDTIFGWVEPNIGIPEGQISIGVNTQAQTLAILCDMLLPRLISSQLCLPDVDAMQAEVCDV
ncbi:MAG: hypothetical protein NT086_15630 [Proteobacteria bacterium]|nr:hypothetical protein [Pseudomonadota bacterium]